MTSPLKKSLWRTNSFVKDIKSLPNSVQIEAFDIAQKLCEDVFHPNLNVRPLIGFKGYYRVVIAKEYRMIFSYNEEKLFLRRIAHRKDIYRSLEL